METEIYERDIIIAKSCTITTATSHIERMAEFYVDLELFSNHIIGVVFWGLVLIMFYVITISLSQAC